MSSGVEKDPEDDAADAVDDAAEEGIVLDEGDDVLEDLEDEDLDDIDFGDDDEDDDEEEE